MNQETLFALPKRLWEPKTKRAPEPEPPKAKARRTDPKTSVDAAASCTEQHLGALHQLIVDELRARAHGATASEIAAAIGYPRDSISPRMKTLIAMKLVRDSGGTRPGPSGRAQTVWQIV